MDQTRLIIRKFLETIAWCEVCENTGTLTFAKSVQVPTTAEPEGSEHPVMRYVRKDAAIICPNCDGHGDPRYMRWICAVGQPEHDCRENNRRLTHEDCGYRLVLVPDLMDGSPAP